MAEAVQAGRVSKTSSSSWVGFFHLFVVYIVWGSTYLAIRVAVMDGGGFPPFTLGAMRLLIAGPILLMAAFLFRHSIRITKDEFIVLAGSGLFLWIGANGLVMWAEQFADSAYTALLLATVPMWVALMEAILDRKVPSKLFIGSLLLGFLGIGILSAPVLLKENSSSDIISVIFLFIAPISWGIGSLWQRRRPVSLNPMVSSGYQQIAGGIGFAFLAMILGEPLPTPSPEAWIAFAYLLVFGSLLTFTSYIMALRLLPTSIVMTYAYVNPVVAVLLGWCILHEPITHWTLAGTTLVLLGVAGSFQSQKTEKQRGNKTNS
ncbi:EamA family transporter [Desulforamulus aeronauticus]|uniref:Permease of the drug/metabolite transporter (DMT) superfamily n=1 Tax=Desulforamulus aeronauticus DSM 10349 TaxID=1121421 RepID=A0A1M6P5I8_9FIRM|nr:EamA family transporter [Desulforamulus aeronauticus]SHK03173.1 Permease of the drug/metabolite transporter (DMT) superfamily [Desulforamulus aeronauticus DSM 10349]